MNFNFTPDFTIPRFLLELGPASETPTLNIPGGNCHSGSGWSLQYSNVHPTPFIREKEAVREILIGSPILGDRIDLPGTLDCVFAEADRTVARARQINGEFLILRIDEAQQKCRIINDRFTSIPLYYIESDGQFAASPYFNDIWIWANQHGERKLDYAALLEFIHFQRLLGTSTYLENAKFLPDASILDWTPGKISIQNYWQRDYSKSKSTFGEHARRMAELVRQSLQSKTSDNKRYGHFLSGGMDSRTVLTAFPDDRLPTCFTATISENREFRTAANIARTRGAEHIGLTLDPEHYGEIYSPASKIIGGMYNYDHGIFLGFQKAVRERADVCFHGHGFDYMFQGMYIPSRRYRIFGRNLYYGHPDELPEDLISYFMNHVSYRIKRARIDDFIKPPEQEKCRERLAAEISKVLSRGKRLTDNPYNLWEYLTFHHISRHYSFPNHASIATYTEQRTASFDNELFDFYLSLPMKHRFDGAIEKACLKLLNPEIARIWSANTDFPVTASSSQQTFYQIMKAIQRRIRHEDLNRESWKERTWPSRDYAIRHQAKLRDAVTQCLDSDILEQIPFLELGKLRRKLPEWLDGKTDTGLSGDLLQTLLTLGTFMEAR